MPLNPCLREKLHLHRSNELKGCEERPPLDIVGHKTVQTLYSQLLESLQFASQLIRYALNFVSAFFRDRAFGM